MRNLLIRADLTMREEMKSGRSLPEIQDRIQFFEGHNTRKGAWDAHLNELIRNIYEDYKENEITS